MTAIKKYKVKVTPDAKSALKRYLSYLKNNLGNPQAAGNVSNDFRETKKTLESVAGAIAEPQSDVLRVRSLKRINFRHHNYFLLFRLVGDVAEVTNMFHGSEDFENKLG